MSHLHLIKKQNNKDLRSPRIPQGHLHRVWKNRTCGEVNVHLKESRTKKGGEVPQIQWNINRQGCFHRVKWQLWTLLTSKVPNLPTEQAKQDDSNYIIWPTVHTVEQAG